MDRPVLDKPISLGDGLKPEPKTIRVECTVCGLPWDAHGADPTLEDCVRLLKAELSKRPTPRLPNFGEPPFIPADPNPWPRHRPHYNDHTIID